MTAVRPCLLKRSAAAPDQRLFALDAELSLHASVYCASVSERSMLVEALDKYRLYLETVSGLSPQTLILELVAKTLADNITSLLCAAASLDHDLAARSRKRNRSYVADFMQRLLPRLVLFVCGVMDAFTGALQTLAASAQRFVRGRSQPRPAHHYKPHPSAAYKG